MRRVFFGYYRPSEEELSSLWEKCVFIVDANVLLNLYRYPKEARDDLVSILKQVSDRLWIPHQAALEYQENRLGVIAEQVKKYRQVRDVLEDILTRLKSQLNSLQLKKRHSTINPDGLIEQTESLFKGFLRQLETLEREQPNVFDPDILRDEIDSIFEGKIGPPPGSQEVLDQIYQEGKERYKQKWPPGYMDEGKSEGNDRSVYVYGGLVFQREYGDLILWEQIIQQAQKQSDFKQIIFITDDTKEDWWWICESQGKKTIGPRPELVGEITSKGGVEQFYMYNSERFMTFAKTYLGIQVKPESITQVRDVTRLRQAESHKEFMALVMAAEQAFLEWLKASYPRDEIVENRHGFPDFIRVDRDSETRIGYELKFSRSGHLMLHRYRDALYRGYYEASEGQIDELVLVLITKGSENLEEMNRSLQGQKLKLPEKTSVLTGLMVVDQEDETIAEFKPGPVQQSLF